MKRLITCLLALTLCAGLMCAPAAAAEESAPSRLTPVQVWGTITRLDDDSILLENSKVTPTVRSSSTSARPPISLTPSPAIR